LYIIKAFIFPVNAFIIKGYNIKSKVRIFTLTD
jgi:hypothetical protein